MDLALFEKKIYSQNGEDGITMKLVDLIYDNHDSKYYVEFGVENGSECNTHILHEHYGWSGLQMDAGHENEHINLKRELITKENVVKLFQKYQVPKKIHLLSVDIDFNDFYCLKKILEAYTCDILICEYNATHLADEDKIVVYDANYMWDRSNYFGASLLSLCKLAEKHQYTLVYCEKKGVNCFFVRDEILTANRLEFKDAGDISKLYRRAGYGGGPNGGHYADPHSRPYLTYADAVLSDITDTFQTKYGAVTLYKNEAFIAGIFKCGGYWDESTLLKLQPYINPDKNILEIGGHCGTSSIVYSWFLTGASKVFVYEPQFNMFQLLLKNIIQNNLQEKIVPYRQGVFCYEGIGKMNDIDLDGGGGLISKRYEDEYQLRCNFGGVGLGSHGEAVYLTTIDNMQLENIGFIHCDAQGAENFIFAKSLILIEKCRPVIFYESNETDAAYLYDSVCKSYPEYEQYSRFDIKKYCMEKLHYSEYIDKFNGGIDTLLIP
jgi:FkbM family methyltransferase